MDDCLIHVLWGRIEGNPYPQFVAAFSDGEVDCWPDMHAARRAEAEQFARGFSRDDEWVEFWTTFETIKRPEFPMAEES